MRPGDSTSREAINSRPPKTIYNSDPLDPSLYRLSVVPGSRYLVEVRKEDGTVYRVALDPAGVPILCTCKGHVNYWHCKHVRLVFDALETTGIETGPRKVLLRRGGGLRTEVRDRLDMSKILVRQDPRSV